MKVAFIYYNMYDRVHDKLHVGGAEHYIYRLSKVCHELGWEPVVFQISDEPFKVKYQHVKIVGVKPPVKFRWVVNKVLYQSAMHEINSSRDLIIFAADLCSVKTGNRRCISINHGLFWDYPTALGGPYPHNLGGIAGTIYKAYVKARMRRLFDNCLNRVCVDYNFLNWYRTATNDFQRKKIWVIPNFARIAKLQAEENQGIIRILFARRFVEYRGTRIMADATKRILHQYRSVSFTFAGEGPDERYLRNAFIGEDRVCFTKFELHEALEVNLRHDICVAPSLAAEGTSLSVAEAMGAGRAVIATNVGGITNMIIDGFNGLLVFPDADSLTDALSRLIDNETLRRELGQAAYETARHAFSFERWREAWVNLLKSFAQME